MSAGRVDVRKARLSFKRLGPLMFHVNVRPDRDVASELFLEPEGRGRLPFDDALVRCCCAHMYVHADEARAGGGGNRQRAARIVAQHVDA